MGLEKILGLDINVADIEKRALEAKETQEKMLRELQSMNQKLEVIKYAAEEVVRFLKTGPLAKP